MQNKINDTTIPLAGLIQAISLVRDIAQTGKTNEPAFKTSIQSIFNTSPENALAVYGNPVDLQVGLEKLLTVLNPTTDIAKLTTRYMLSLMRIQKKIFSSPALVNKLSQRINQVKKQVDYFSLTHPTVIANLADIYIDVITPFRYRFYLLGNQQILSVHENMEKIRALLLAAIRSSVLWRQLGGSRLQLIFSRGKISASATNILKDMSNLQGALQ